MTKTTKRTPKIRPLAAEFRSLAKRQRELNEQFDNLAQRLTLAAAGADAVNAFVTIEDSDA